MEAIGVFRPKLGSTLSFCSQTNLFPACKLHRFLATSYPPNHAHFVSLKATANPLACGDEENNRNIRKPFPSKWDHQSLFGNLDFSQMDALGREIEALKPQVRNMLISSKGIKKKFLFTYLLVTLGVAYHFEDEIMETLKDGFQKIEEMMAGEDDLYTVSVIFYVFRTYGYNISSDVFGRFLGDHGEFKKCLTRDAKGILSLYEAAHMGTTTDYILDEALTFTLSNLESLSCTCKPNLSRLIRNSLGLAQHKNMEILVAKEFIRFYEKEEDSDLTLIKFSKLNFKFLQLLYLQELKILSKWYKEQDFESKLPPYYRDILVELNLHTLTYLEPKYSRVRIFLTKFYVMQVIVDDTCDRYASLREVEILADIFERYSFFFERDFSRATPGVFSYIIILFSLLWILDLTKNFILRLNVIYKLLKNLQLFEKHTNPHKFTGFLPIPRFPNLKRPTSMVDLERTAYKSVSHVFAVTEEMILSCRGLDKLNKAIATKARVFNDMFGYEDDMNRGYLTGSVNCYKKQYGVTEEEAFRKLHQLIAEFDKMMNEEILKPINVPRQVLKVVMIDTLRAVNVAYNKQDGFTRPDGHLKNITSMLVDL
ncbi:unnamed protein product [Brassica rapa subsp. narinosa]